MSLQLERVSSLKSVAPAAWNALSGGSPFLRHEFLSALESSGCVGRSTAWQPAYLLAKDGADLQGAVPLYIKHDSRGEFVFDWGWADAHERAGLRYYPKLVASVPFTPATGARLLVRAGADAALVQETLIRGALAAAKVFSAARAANSTGTTRATPTSTIS